MITMERKEKLFRAMEKLEAYRLIQNEMGRAVAAFNFRQAERLLSFFALDQEGVALEYCDEGLFEGREAVETIIREVVGAEVKPGEMLDMQLTTPMIEIADDLKTAKCLWWMPGAGAIPQEEGDPMAIWAWASWPWTSSRWTASGRSGICTTSASPSATITRAGWTTPAWSTACRSRCIRCPSPAPITAPTPPGAFATAFPARRVPMRPIRMQTASGSWIATRTGKEG